MITPAPILAADYTAGRGTIMPMLTINRIENGRREVVEQFVVTGKRHARDLAAELSAKPWNF